MTTDINNLADLSKANQTAELSSVMVPLLKGVIYRDDEPRRWADLLSLRPQIRDYIAVLGLQLILDEAEGYAFVRSRPADDDSSASESAGEHSAVPAMPIPKLVSRRPLSLPVSLLLALLRKRLAEFDASGSETRLVLSLEKIVEMMRLFLPDGSNEVKLVDQIETHISKVIKLGFLRLLKASSPGEPPAYEVRRIIKAFVDAQWLSELDGRLATYQLALTPDDNETG
mgnify:CR=1 FL=1